MQYEFFPKTRYLGSKRKLLPVLCDVFSSLSFETALDPFCGTGSVAYLLKSLGAAVTASDTMRFNVATARALVVNQTLRIRPVLEQVLSRIDKTSLASGFVAETFDGLFFYAEENRFIDRCLKKIGRLSGEEQDMLLFCLGQAALAKRPYNLFHRANLDMRRRDVARSFGNKTTWDTPFPVLMRRFADELDAAIFDSGVPCRAIASDVLDLAPSGFDLVYLDPPYVSEKGNGVDYLDYYHFLEGLAEPAVWASRILHQYKHKPLAGRGSSPWCDPSRVAAVFEETVRRFVGATLVISYRSDGIPSIEALRALLGGLGKQVSVIDVGKYTYALSKNRKSKEIILVAR